MEKMPMLTEGTAGKAILWLRGVQVVLDSDLAVFYGVTTKQLNQAVKRDAARFPDDFMFELTGDEKGEVVTKCDHLEKLKYSSVPPKAFTEHGVLMVAGVLSTSRAVEVSIALVRVFIRRKNWGRVRIKSKFARRHGSPANAAG